MLKINEALRIGRKEKALKLLLRLPADLPLPASALNDAQITRVCKSCGCRP